MCTFQYGLHFTVSFNIDTISILKPIFILLIILRKININNKKVINKLFMLLPLANKPDDKKLITKLMSDEVWF